MGISHTTVLSIFMNPYDLTIFLGCVGGKYGFGINRGPRDNFRILVDSNGFAPNAEDAITELRNRLTAIYETMMRESKDPESVTSQHFYPRTPTFDQSKVLNPTLIDQICNDLRRHYVAKTYEMSAPTA